MFGPEIFTIHEYSLISSLHLMYSLHNYISCRCALGLRGLDKQFFAKIMDNVKLTYQLQSLEGLNMLQNVMGM